MWTKLHWVDGPWPGRLALAARPRGGEWVDDEMAAWRRAGVDVVVSLLTPDEAFSLDLDQEPEAARLHGLKYVSIPIPDREVPDSETRLADALAEIEQDLMSGRNVVLHCRQGIGRTGLVAACLLVSKGCEPEKAVEHLSAVRGARVPETPEQRRWIDRYAEVCRIAP